MKQTRSEAQKHLVELPQDYVLDLQRIAEALRYAAVRRSAQVIGFCSALPEEGVSTFVTDLAQVMATRNARLWQSESRPVTGQLALVPGSSHLARNGILLIDTQFENPALHKIFKLNNKEGRLDLLVDQVHLYELVKDTAASELELITSGQQTASAFEQMDLQKLYLLLEHVRSRFEMIFVDIPPLLHSAEGIPICQMCDGIVLVVRAHKTRWQAIEEARRRLHHVEANIFGTVLTQRRFFIPGWLYRML